MPEKITSLTPAQEARFQEWADRWIAIGLSTEPADFQRAEEGVRGCYRAASLPEPRVVLHFGSPLSAVLAGVLATRLLAGSARVYNKDAKQAVDGAVSGAVSGAVRRAVDGAVRQAVAGAVDWAFEGAVVGAVDGRWGDYRGGNLWSAWYAFVTFFRDVCGWSNPCLADFAHDEKCAMSASWCWYGSQVAAIADRPAKLLLSDGVLHHDGGSAIAWRDGWELFYLHGVRVPEWLACQRDTEIDPAKIAEITNAEVRREFVRKIGLERIRHKLGGRLIEAKTVRLHTPLLADWPCNYRLEELSFGDRKRRVLVMDNPSLPEIQHVEYVPVECETVEQAMNFRLDRREEDVDDENGSPWWLHGDVIIKPEGATKTKRWPERIA